MADFGGSVSRIDVSSSGTMPAMKPRWLGIVGLALLGGTMLPTRFVAQTTRGPVSAEAMSDKVYARIAVLRPHDGHTVDFEAGYIRYLDWHRQARDTWVWYGWNVRSRS